MDELTLRSRRLVVIGTLMGMFVSSTNVTVVSTALPSIISSLGGLNLLSWVFTAYMLTSTVTVPVSGKLGDLYGRRALFLGGIALFMGASAAAGLSQTIEQLIVLRGLQGVGGGLIISNAYAIIGDIFPPAERSKYQGLFSGVFGISSVMGPFIGGLLTDHLSWRGVFYINVPFALMALGLLWSNLPSMNREFRPINIDFWGAGLLSASVICVLLALVWAGPEYAWTSATILGLFILGTGLAIAFVLVETRASEPVLPLHLFKNQVFIVASLLTLVSGISMYGVITYMPMFVQGVIGYSATNSGLVTAPMMIGFVFASALSGFLASRLRRTRPFVIAGGLIQLMGMLMLSRFGPETGRLEASLGMVIVGTGIGASMPIINLVVQNAFSRHLLGVATSSTQFFRQIGGTLGVAVFGTLVVTGVGTNLDHNLSPEVRAQIPTTTLRQLEEPQTLLNEDAKVRLESDFARIGPEGPALYEISVEAARKSLSDAVTAVFFLGFSVSVVAAALSILVPERGLRSTWEESPTSAKAELAIAPPAVRVARQQAND